MKNNRKVSLKHIFLIPVAIIFALCIFGSFFLKVDFPVNENDLILYRISILSLIIPLELGILCEMNLFGLLKKITLVKSCNLFKHILFWFVTIFIAILLFSIPYSKTSQSFKNQLNTTNKSFSYKTTTNNKADEIKNQEKETQISKKAETTITYPSKTEINTENITETVSWEKLTKNKDRYKLVLTLLGKNFCSEKYSKSKYSQLNFQEKELVKKLYQYYNKKNSLPKDFTQSFTDFCTAEEYSNMILETYDNPFYAALSESFVVSWSSDGAYYIRVREDNNQTSDEYVTKDKPLTFVFSDNKNVVGNCSVVLTKIEIVQEGYKKYHGEAPTYAKYIRLHATIKNNSSQKTEISAKKSNSFIIGQYCGTKKETTIGHNNNYNWENDDNITTDVAFKLKPKEIKNVCITGVFIDEDQFKYSSVPRIDIYFTSNNETLTVPINK